MMSALCQQQTYFFHGDRFHADRFHADGFHGGGDAESPR
jgi:hypothetical protein